MTDSPGTASPEGPVAGGAQPAAASSPAAGSPLPAAQESAAGIAAEHPELMVGAAFAGGLLLATILKRRAS